jgi:hypothetical protein
MKRKYVLFVFVALTVILTVSVYGQDKVKTFPKYNCQLKLPVSSWQWNDQHGIPHVLAFAESKNSIKMLLSVLPMQNKRLDSDFIAGYEEEFLNNPGMRKIEGKRLVFQGLPAYELTAAVSDADALIYSRVFLTEQAIYSLQLIIPQKMKTNPTVRERLFNSFSFIEKTNQSDQELVPNEQPSKAETDPNELSARKTEFNDPNALLKELGLKTVTYTISDGPVKVKVDVVKSVHVKVSSKEGFCFVAVGAEDRKLMPNDSQNPHYSSVPAECSVTIRKQTMEEALKSWKKSYIDGIGNRKLLKRKDMKGYCLALIVDEIVKNKSSEHRAFQFIQVGEYVVTIEARSDQLMGFRNEYKKELNAILQTAIKSIRINNKLVNVEEFANHVIRL